MPRTLLQKRVAVFCPDCGQGHNTPENFPGWFDCTKCGRHIFWRDVKEKATPEKPRRVLDE